VGHHHFLREEVLGLLIAIAVVFLPLVSCLVLHSTITCSLVLLAVTHLQYCYNYLLEGKSYSNRVHKYTA